MNWERLRVECIDALDQLQPDPAASRRERESPRSRHRKAVTESPVIPSNVALGCRLLW